MKRKRRRNPRRAVRRTRPTLRSMMHVRRGARGLTERESRRLDKLERRYDRLVGRSPNPRRRNPATRVGGSTLRSIMALQAKREVRKLTAKEARRLTELETKWSNAWLHPSQYPTRSTNPRHRRRTNPRSPLFKLLAQKRTGGKRLVYVGAAKFAEAGRPVYFKTPDGARTVAKLLRLQFPMLKRYAFAVAGA
jgi:hypothetical protein